MSWSAALSRTADIAWQQIFAELQRRFPDAPPFAIIGTGGYGRSDLAPYSDLDVAVVPGNQSAPNLDEAVRWLFREAQAVFTDANHVALGYTYRSQSDVPGLDSRTLSSLIDARFIAGDPEPFEDLLVAIWKTFPIGEFIVTKREERRVQMDRTHDSPLVVEPNLKLGAGGLRCVQTARMIRAAMGERPCPFPPSYEVVHGARVILQHVAKRNTDNLTRARLEEVAAVMDMEPRSLASALAGAMEDNHDLYLDSLDRIQESRFILCPGVEAVRGEARPTAFATVGQACNGTHLAMQLGLRISTGWSSLDPYVGAEIVDLFTQTEETIRCWHRCGLLVKALPELERCHTMISHDSSHKYTVYEHTLRAVRLVDQVPSAHPIAAIKASLAEPGLLMLAILMHDAGKADRRAPHSETGARMALEVCSRWGIDKTQSALVEWLVREHLTMSKFARLRDIELPETAREFAAIVQIQERLDALTVLTWADVQAVAPGSWSPLQEAFLLELHRRTSEALAASNEPQVAVHPRPRKVKPEDVDHANLNKFLDSLPPHYLLSAEPTRVNRHFAMAQRAIAGEVAIEAHDMVEVEATEITVSCQDASGILSRMMGVLYAHDASLISLRAATTTGSKPIVLDVFTVQSGRRPLARSHVARIVKDLTAVIDGTDTVESVLTRSGKDPSRPQQVLDISVVESEPVIVEIRAPRGRGMPYRVCRVIAEEGWNVLSARVGQWAGTGTAAFYISSANGPVSVAQVERAFARQQV